MNIEKSQAEEALRDAAREYHRTPTKGKISITPTKPLSNQRDLSLAYSPGVAYPCLDIQADPSLAAEYTSRGNLVGVITNGTAVLGLGDIGPLAGKPVMEGKGCLFKKFAGIDVFDIELAERDPDKLVDIVAALEPTLGGINLEDIKAPECFYIEKKLRERLNIPVFHDDQHGTAIISGAALLNGLELVGKKIGEVKLVSSGAGRRRHRLPGPAGGPGRVAAQHPGGRLQGRDLPGTPGGYDESKAKYAQDTSQRTLADAVKDADVFLGCSTGGVLTARWSRPWAASRSSWRWPIPSRRSGPSWRKAGAARLHHRHRPFGLPEPGQQRAVLPLHLPRRAGLRRHQDHGSDEARLRARDRAAWPRPTSARKWPTPMPARSCPSARLHHPDAVRLAPDPAHRAGGGAGGGGVGRGHAADPGLRRLHAEPHALRLPDRHDHAAGVPAAKKSTAKRVAYAEGEDERVLRAAQLAVDEKLAQPILIGRPR
jgi:malate dehydrogenase (oxaloacetate-decarboxylating)(NADP+)